MKKNILSKVPISTNSIGGLAFLALLSLSIVFVLYDWWVASIIVGLIATVVYYTACQEGVARIDKVKSANRQLSSSFLSMQIDNSQDELIKRNLIEENEEIKFLQLATYKGGILGHPDPLEDVGYVLILSDSFVFYDKNISWKLPYKRIIDAKLDFFQPGAVRSMLALGEVARQLQETKNTLSLVYLDTKYTERIVKFQIHDALTIPGEAKKATEFLNHLLEFKEYFSNIIENHENDAASKLEKLKKPKDSNIITKDEFKTKKRELLDEF